MEEDTFGSCGIVYFCASAPEDLSELFHKTKPPEVPQNASDDQKGLSQVYRNVWSLLDEDQGGFDEGKLIIEKYCEIEYRLTVPSVRMLTARYMSQATRQLRQHNSDRGSD